MKDIEDILRVKNNYSDKNERISFAIEIMKQKAPKGWKQEDFDPFIELLLKEVYFSQYILLD